MAYRIDRTKNEAKSIFVANVKGGVGKSTLSIMLARALETKIPSQNITVIDTDLQRTTTEFLSSSNPVILVGNTPRLIGVCSLAFITAILGAGVAELKDVE